MNELISFPHLQKVLADMAIEVRNKYQDNLITSDRLASGELLNSVEYVTSFQGKQFWIGLKLEEYWKYVENDTKPHFPPMEAILKWIEVKPILPYPDKNGKLPTPKQLAYLIGRKISEEGTEGSHDLQDAMDEINVKYESLIMDAIDTDITDEVTGIIRVLYSTDKEHKIVL